MKGLAMVLLAGALATAFLPCAADTDCTEVAVQSTIESVRAELTLADLLVPGSCERLRRAAASVKLGGVPGGGFVRVLDGEEIRGRLEGLVGEDFKRKKTLRMEIPKRISVRRAGAIKSCADFARFVSAASTKKTVSAPRPMQGNMDCAGAPTLPEDTPLELIKTTWNMALHRWEFALRCARPEDCVPFLLWFHEANTSAQLAGIRDEAVQRAGLLARRVAKDGGIGQRRLVHRGQTVTLTWYQSGIRIVLPVTCIDAGGLGEFVWVRFKNAPGILRAEVMADGTLRASL